MIYVHSKLEGFDELSQLLVGMRDDRGRKWRKAALIKSGNKSFSMVVRRSRQLAPRRTGVTRRSIISKHKYNITGKGNLSKRGRYEYLVSTTLSPSFQGRRYPFMLEVGVKQGTYNRRSHWRDRGNGKFMVRAHSYNRRATRNPLMFQHRALNTSATQLVNSFASNLFNYLDLYLKHNVKTLRTAIKYSKRG